MNAIPRIAELGIEARQDGLADSLVQINDVGYSYPSGTVALQNVSLSIERGSVVGIAGPSGCGKSTLLQLVAGLTAPTHGHIVTNLDQHANSTPMTMVFQQDTLMPWFTVTENMMVYQRFGRNRRAGRRFGRGSRTVNDDYSAEQRDLAEELLELAGLTKFANSYPYQLSGGMKRRLAFITAVAPRPSLLLLDEPFASVDEPTRVQIHQDVLRIVSRFNMTAILVTHDLAEAISLSDRVIIMSKGPGRVYGEHAIPFGDSRTVLELRQEPEFLRLYGELWQDLSLQLRL